MFLSSIFVKICINANFIFETTNTIETCKCPTSLFFSCSLSLGDDRTIKLTRLLSKNPFRNIRQFRINLFVA